MHVVAHTHTSLLVHTSISHGKKAHICYRNIVTKITINHTDLHVIVSSYFVLVSQFLSETEWGKKQKTNMKNYSLVRIFWFLFPYPPPLYHQHHLLLTTFTTYSSSWIQSECDKWCHTYTLKWKVARKHTNKFSGGAPSKKYAIWHRCNRFNFLFRYLFLPYSFNHLLLPSLFPISISKPRP